MKNLDNKTKKLDKVCLTQFINLIENNPCHIATIGGGQAKFKCGVGH